MFFKENINSFFEFLNGFLRKQKTLIYIIDYENTKLAPWIEPHMIYTYDWTYGYSNWYTYNTICGFTMNLSGLFTVYADKVKGLNVFYV